ncbi:LIM domain kinase 1 isoform X2 [Galleria mellonella]|uniref:non-specific serine/threonine protein kinase n=1 Tax=Galleria mellonella TaxID=7137 RepID=A0ABM3N278_GALME|nr:LIM domain kinase 1 isoform X2 [Galleria mellonella]
MEGSHNKESLNCAGCLNDIGDDDYVSALGQDWHKDCFRCSVCDALLSTWYFEKAGLLFCQNDYWMRFGENCQQCGQVMTGPVMSAGEHRFHPECFACCRCGSHIEDGEPYALLDRTHLYCGGCYGQSDGCGGGAGGGEEVAAVAASRPHSIRVVEVPAAALRRPPLLHALDGSQIDSACGLLTLHIGDRILEINGTPVRNRPVDELDKVLARPDAVIQLTIEHNPETTNNNKRAPMCKIITDLEDKPKHDIKSPVERKILREDLKKNIPIRHSNEVTDNEGEDSGGKKERLFKRKGEDGGKVRLKRRQTPSSPLLGDKERSSSMSKLLDVSAADARSRSSCEERGVLHELSRARSFRAAPAPAPPTVFRAADLLQGELLGSGFFGQVYKVTHRDTNEVMVLKQLYRVDEDAQRNFLKEVAVLRSLRHPNVLRFVGVLYKDKRLHLVTEYVAGGTLHHLIQDPGVSLSWAARARLARDVAAGVGYLHRRNVIHRDLNSHNCLVREDQTVIVADFGLARIVQRTASSTLERPRAARVASAGPTAPSAGTLRRKRYTVVGNPYWMAPEMMNGNSYDEKVDVFSFGIILCEIIGRVSADPDFLPRRADFGLNETVFVDKFCRSHACPEPFYRVAFRACHLEPDCRPTFEVIEIWLETLIQQLCAGASTAALLDDICRYGAAPACGLQRSPSKLSGGQLTPDGLVKSKSNVTIEGEAAAGEAGEAAGGGRALGKCVSAGHISAARPVVTVTTLSRSHHSLHPAPAGYILRAHGNSINITKVDDISKWLDSPPPLKRTSPDSQLNTLTLEHNNKTRKVDAALGQGNLPCFLRNQSVEGLESKSKHDMDPPHPICRHISIPDDCEITRDQDTDSSDDDDDLDIADWHRNVSTFQKVERMDVDQSKNILTGLMKKGENLLAKKSSYDVTDISLRNPECLKGERRIPETDCRRYNIDFLTKSPIMAEGVKNIPKSLEVREKPTEKSGFFTKKLLSPKFSRLFSPEVSKSKPENCENKEEKSRSKFFIHRPASPSNICRSYKVRPSEDRDRKPNLRGDNSDVLKSDLKLASLGKPMTPIFRRHLPTEKPEFADGRFSYRDRRSKYDGKSQEPKFVEIGRNRIKAPINAMEKNKLTPLIRSSQINTMPALTPVLEKNKGEVKEKKEDVPKRREVTISRSNYVSLANLKINSKARNLEKTVQDKSRSTVDEGSPVERVI